MLIKVLFFSFFVTLLTGPSFAQSSKKRSAKHRDPKAFSVESYYPKNTYEPKKNKEIKSYDAEHEKKEARRMGKKRQVKNERLTENPHFYDPEYFGHKSVPKKHRPGRMKVCKVCGIRH